MDLKTAKRDLELLMGALEAAHTPGQELYATQIMLTISGIKRQLEKPENIQRFYLGEAKQHLPRGLVMIAEHYVVGEMTREEATAELENTEAHYRELLTNAGY